MIPFGTSCDGNRRNDSISDSRPYYSANPNTLYVGNTKRRGKSADGRRGDDAEYFDGDRYGRRPVAEYEGEANGYGRRRYSTSVDRFDRDRNYADGYGDREYFQDRYARQGPEQMAYGYGNTIDRYLPRTRHSMDRSGHGYEPQYVDRYSQGKRYEADRDRHGDRRYALDRSHFESERQRRSYQMSGRDVSQERRISVSAARNGERRPSAVERRPSQVERRPSAVARSPSNERRIIPATRGGRASVSRSPSRERRVSLARNASQERMISPVDRERRVSISRSVSQERKPSVVVEERRMSAARSPTEPRRPSVAREDQGIRMGGSPNALEARRLSSSSRRSSGVQYGDIMKAASSPARRQSQSRDDERPSEVMSPRERKASESSARKQSESSRRQSESETARRQSQSAQGRKVSVSRSPPRDRKPSSSFVSEDMRVDSSPVPARRLSSSSGRRLSEAQDASKSSSRRQSTDREREGRPFGMQGASEFQRGGQVGSQFGSDRMPPPIPPFSDARPNYPGTMTMNNDENDVLDEGRDMIVRTSYDFMRRRYYERAADPSQNPTWLQHGEFGNHPNMVNVSDNVLRIDDVDFRSRENSKEHRTFEYELVKDTDQRTPVYRRGQTFVMNIILRDRDYDSATDLMYLNFYIGPNPSVPKRTRIVLPVFSRSEFERVPYQWDSRILLQEPHKITVEVNIPGSCPVGLWRCVLETASKDNPEVRLQYRCQEEMYVIFNPFEKEDPVFMEDDEQRYEYVINDSGKVYTGGYRNVRGRPWIYGQFDDCVLPAACVMLEMSGLPRAERGNPVKVTRALSSMICSSPDNKYSNSENDFPMGMIEPRYEGHYEGGYSPHMWSGSVQIIEEFLRRGATPVKYSQCWVMAALMTSLCRALGLPARPVTAFVCALDTQDSLTADRYLDRSGDILEHGPKKDQPDSLWSFHTWCDVWMHRTDQPKDYSGWQAVDPSRPVRNTKEMLSSVCGPCPVEALRRGDIGQRDDVDSFFASLNSYVRHFYEDGESGWGYSPFRQFRLPVSRYILTKSVGRFDDEGDDDCQDITNMYRDNEISDDERFTIFNSCRGVCKDTPAFEYQAAALNRKDFNPSEMDQRNFDVTFTLEPPERVMVGHTVTVPLKVHNTSSEARAIQTNICTRSSYYTGNLGPYLKRSTKQLLLDPNQQETLTLSLDHFDYEDKLVDMAFIKITVSGFVQETGQSFADEFDFRFNKPWINIQTQEMKVGEKSEATFSFTNPLDMPLTDCFFTMEVSGSVRPRTIRIDREVRPREVFTYTQAFIPRSGGDRRMMATFASRQLVDVLGQRPVVVQE